jgi:predicted dehydrogenase
MVMYDDSEPTEKIKVYDKGITVNGSSETAHQLRIAYRAGDMWAPHLSTKEALQEEAEHFVSCIRNAATPISCGLTGLRVVEILEATSRSIATRGSPIRLEHR